MKKFLLLSLAAMLFPMAMSAQSLRAKTLSGELKRAGVIQSYDTRHKAPAKIDLARNQKILGHYDTDAVYTGGCLGLTGFAGVHPIAVLFTPEELEVFQGGKIIAFRVGLSSSTPVTRVFVAPSTEEGLGEFTEWSCSVSNEGWNMVTLDPPYEINLDENTSLMVGFDYTQTSSNYPLSYVEQGDTYYPSYVYLTYQGETDWFDIGTEEYGNLSLQCIVESDNFPAYKLKMAQMKARKFVKAGEELDYSFKIKNEGIEDVPAGAVNFVVTLDGDTVDAYTNPDGFATDFVSVSGKITSEGLEMGEHTMVVTMTSLNGEALESPQSLELNFKVIEYGFPRQKHLVEQFTSHSCTYCPLGTTFLDALMAKRDDIARVAVHGNQSRTDPYNTPQCDSIFSYVGMTGFPTATFDRTSTNGTSVTSVISYGDDESAVNSWCDFFDEISDNQPSFATIDGECVVNPISRKATISIFGEMIPNFVEMMGEDAKLTVYITEDSLFYNQLNLGKWVKNYQHDAVMRYAVGSVLGVDLNKDGDNYKNDFEIILPDDWTLEHLHVVALISRPLINGARRLYTDLFVNNAETFDFTILPATAQPEITVETTDSTVIITATGEGEVLLYVDGEPVENPYTITRGEEEVTVTVTATAQEGDKLMNSVTQQVLIPAIEGDAVEELLAGKTVAGVRYYNMMGQEMTAVRGATLVITTYTDGSTCVTKVMK